MPKRRQMPSEEVFSQEAEALYDEFIQPLGSSLTFEKLERTLKDLEPVIARKAGEMIGPEASSLLDEDSFCLDMADFLPAFDLDILRSSRMSAVSLGSAVFLGWILGGILSGILGFLNLGGDILRAAAIFGMIWLEEYVSANAKFRKNLLKYLGWASLAGVAARVASGAFRIVGGFRASIFGLAKPGIFKGAWLLVGTAFIFIFFSKKETGLNWNASRTSLVPQISERLKLIWFILDYMLNHGVSIDENLRNETPESIRNLNAVRELVKGIVDVLDSIPDGPRSFLLDRLASAGYAVETPDASVQIWNSEIHPQLYNPIGFINSGDRFLVLKKPLNKNGAIIKGTAQAITAQEGQ